MTEYTADQVLAGINEWAAQAYQHAGQRVEVALHGGRFTSTDLKRYATRHRACRIALEGLRFQVTGQGALLATAQVVVVLLAGDDGKAGTRALNVLQVAAVLLGALPASRCGLELHDSINAKDVRSANLYNAALDQAGTAGWVITWPVSFQHPRVR